MDSTLLIIEILFVSLLFNIPLSKFKIPPIIGYIFTGILIISFVDVPKDIIQHISEFGIIFLMFMIGLEFSFDKLISMKKEVFVFGVLEIVVVSILFTIMFILFGEPFKISIVIGSALALSSTAIVLKLLNESREISKPYGRVSLGILLFQDIAVIPILIMISIISNDNANVIDMLVKTTIDVFIVLALIIVVGRFIIPKIIHLASTTKSDEIFMASVLLVVLSSAELAHYFNLSYTLGAFMAGMLISETKYKYQVEASLVPFRDILLGLFFVSIGLLIDIKFTFNHIIEILSVTVLVMFVKSLVIYAILRFFNPNRVAIKSAIALSQIGEFSFVIFSLMSLHHLGSPELIQKLVVVAVLSMLFTPFLLQNLYKMVKIIDDVELEAESFEIKDSGLKNHIIIVGYNEISERLCSKFEKFLYNYVVIDKQIENVKRGIKNSHNVILGNAADKNILEHLKVEEASNIIITTKNEMNTILIAENILAINENLNVIALAPDREDKENFESLNIKYVIDENKLIATKLFERAVQCKIDDKDNFKNRRENG